MIDVYNKKMPKTSNLKQWFFDTIRDVSASAHQSPSGPDLAALTVVIPSYGRQDYLLRQVIYWSETEVSVVIVDGSPTPLEPDVQEKIADFPHIRYVHSLTPFFERMRLAGSMLKTQYAVMSGDDEFLLKKGLSQALSRLENDKSLVACMGQSFAFHVDRETLSITYGSGYPHWRYEGTESTAKARLDAAMSNYIGATCYAVLRSEVWHRSWGKHGPWSSPYTGEIQQALATYIRGKVTAIDEVYWMRSGENAPVNTNQYNRSLSFEDWWHGAQQQGERELFVSMLSTELTEAEGTPAIDATNIVKDAVGLYIKHVDGAKPDGLRPIFFGFINQVLPDKLRARLKSIVFRLRSMAREGNFGTLADMRRTPPPSVHANLNDALFRELSHVESLIMQFHTARKADAA